MLALVTSPHLDWRCVSSFILWVLIYPDHKRKTTKDVFLSFFLCKNKWKDHIYEVLSKIFWTDAVKIVKLTIRPIGPCHPRSSSLPHVNTSPTASSIFRMLPGSPFLSECQAVSAIHPVSPQRYQTGVLSASISFLEIGRSHRVHQSGKFWIPPRIISDPFKGRSPK